MPPPANKWILEFDEIDKEDVALAGGKGANLGEIAQAGFPVPAGFVVSSEAYKLFIKENFLERPIKELLGSLNTDSPEELARASEKIKKLFLRGKVPEELAKEIIKRYQKMSGIMRQVLVAVRSSATAEDLPAASFAGQQETFLNVQGEANLIEKVKACWASLFTPRAIFYRQQKRFDHFKVAIATVVQEMIQSEVSGVAFTTEPTGHDKHKMVIEAVWGLGELIVQGAVTPDRYELERHTLKILDIKKNPQDVQLVKMGGKTQEKRVPRYRRNRQKLSEAKIKELARILQKIHNHYYFPQDVEWAYKGGKFYVIQSRPVTTLGKDIKDIEGIRKLGYSGIGDFKAGEPLLRGVGASPGIATGHVRIVKSAKQLGKVKKGDVLVARMTSPDYVPAMKRAGAIVTDEGGTTSHAAIVSRELGIPCVVGTGEATKLLRDEMVVTVHGGIGEVYRGGAVPTQITNSKSQIPNKVIEARSDIKTATKIYVNLAEPELAEKAAYLPVDGVGLLRAEFMLAGIGVHPRHIILQGRQEEFISKLASGLEKFCEAFEPRPVVYRSTDFKTNEYRNLDGGKAYEPEEPNPMLGYRGAARYIADVDVFELELAAVKRVRERYKNLWLMLPYVRSPLELLRVKRIMAASGLVRSPTFRLWMMVELPVNVIRLEEFVKVGIDGVSVGSNDLTMLITGTDRDNSEVAQAFNELDPAVLWSLERVVKICRKERVTSSICGQAPSVYETLVEYLVNLGITSISVNTDAVGRVQKVIYEAELKKIRNTNIEARNKF